MADYGLMSGLAKGLQAGFESYRETKKMNQEAEAKKAMAQLQEKQYRAGLIEKGLLEDPNSETGFSLSPDEQRKRAIDQAVKIGDVQAKGLSPEYDDKGLIKKFNPDPNSKAAQDKANDRTYKNLQIKKLGQEISQGNKVPAGEAAILGSANAAMSALSDTGKLYDTNSDITGPGQGLISRAAGLFQVGDTGKKAASFDAIKQQHAQVIGTYLENGKLTDNDFAKYQKMLPNLTDSPEVKDAKIQGLQRLIAEKQAKQKAALEQANYNVGDIETSKIPEAVGRLGKKPQGLLPQAEASGKPKVVKQNGHTYILNEKTGEYE